ncbi:hypothetical protein AQUCO_01600305v1 [Aquilegia coerulea]|uniref:Aberrant root formation protein 4 n=1 Tax=Aquilegia coerulea TaxID=218851 RepID=A0A2G5DR10_AQUCA|nr:hypothetical protein AQUCO_01600305v1 [Aquilegia coerulea]
MGLVFSGTLITTTTSLLLFKLAFCCSVVALLQLKHEEETMSNDSVIRLQELLNTCSTCIISGESEDAVSSLVEFINQIHEELVNEEEEEEEVLEQNAIEILNELLCFISSPSIDQMVVDALSFVLPKLVVKFAPVSNKFCEIAEAVIDRLISTCSPRDMLAVICDVLDCPHEMFNEPAYFTPLLGGLSKVFVSLKRRHFEHMKVALPAVLKVLQAAVAELSDETINSFKNLIARAIQIATSIQEVCQKLEGGQKEQIRALLSLFVLPIVALASITLPDENSNMLIMSQLSQFLRFCNLSYLGLVTGGDVDASTIIVRGGVEESEDCMSCSSLVKEGAFIAVVWGMISDDVAKAADEDLTVVKENLRNSQAKRWQTVGMVKYLLASIHQPWKVKEDAVDFLLCIMESNTSPKNGNENADCSSYVPSLYSAVQAIEMVIIYAPDGVLRKKFFAALKLVLADIPTYPRFEILKSSITNNDHPSMIAILIDIVKGEILMEISQKGFRGNNEIVKEDNEVRSISPFLSTNVLELVEFVLKPPHGGHPSLPEQSDAVLSALNLYRFLLITESTGKTNYTGILSEKTLQKAYREWLLPLRTLVTGITAETEKECCELVSEELCSLNPLQLVLYRCIELIEEKLQQSA